MANIAHFISTQVDRPVIDATGLKGQYAMKLSWFKESGLFQPIQDQLGLKLQPAKSKIDTVVIDVFARLAMSTNRTTSA